MDEVKLKESEIDLLFPPGVLTTLLRLSTTVVNSMESATVDVGPICQIFINTVRTLSVLHYPKQVHYSIVNGTNK